MFKSSLLVWLAREYVSLNSALKPRKGALGRDSEIGLNSNDRWDTDAADEQATRATRAAHDMQAMHAKDGEGTISC